MKKLILGLLFCCFFSLVFSQQKAFRFAFISDTHIGSPNGAAEEDLRRTVRDINAMNDIAFVVLTGDITELGTNDELKLARQILDSLKIKWYIIPGNHDTGWSESGGVMFSTIFGDDKFSFEYNGIRFLGCASGPYVRMSDGHVPRDAVNWLDKELQQLTPNQPLIFLNHYPIDNGLDNWYEITDRLRRVNTLAILCGHGHANKAMNFEDIPGVMGRSNLRAKATVGGYNLVDVTADAIIFTERKPAVKTLMPWTTVAYHQNTFSADKKFPRPDFSSNEKYKGVKTIWEHSSDANIISTPAVANNKVIVGNQNGVVRCFNETTGELNWQFKTGAAIFSSPSIANNSVVFGTGDGSIYCLAIKNGKQRWKKKMQAAVLGSPFIHGDTVFIGSSDHHFSALRLQSGKTIWQFDGLEGPVVSTPLWYKGQLIFGAWDTYLYSLQSNTGVLNWKWNNGSTIRNYSPASCIPVASDDIVYIMAPDRYISAIDVLNGQTIWRSKDGGVRESIGIAANGKWIYGKSMKDTIVGYATGRDTQKATWKLAVGFGYEHVPSMLIEKDGLVFFGTKNGVVYCIEPEKQEVIWSHKIDNSMVNTVNVLGDRKIVVATMDGKLSLLQY